MASPIGDLDLRLAECAVQEGFCSASELRYYQDAYAGLDPARRPDDFGHYLVEQGILRPDDAARLRHAARALSHPSRETSAPDDEQIPARLGGYELLARIDSGGMGTVFKARQIKMQRIVALKVLAKRLSAEPRYIKRFWREAQSAGKLNHPNIVQVHDVGEDQGFHYFSMEYVDGVNAQQLLRREGRFAPLRALRIIQDVALALVHAEKHGIVHRDIKPDNILLTRGERQVKLADLGLAKRVEAHAGDTGTRENVAMGTPYYMAVEQGRRASKVDSRADIYALGATFYHMVTGQVPFDGETSLDILMKAAQEPLVPPMVVHPEVPPAMSQVIEKMMEKDPDDRYQTAPALLEDLILLRQRLESGDSSPLRALVRDRDTPALGERERERATARRKRIRAVLIGATGLLALTSLALLVTRSKPRGETPPATPPIVVAQVNQAPGSFPLPASDDTAAVPAVTASPVKTDAVSEQAPDRAAVNKARSQAFAKIVGRHRSGGYSYAETMHALHALKDEATGAEPRRAFGSRIREFEQKQAAGGAARLAQVERAAFMLAADGRFADAIVILRAFPAAEYGEETKASVENLRRQTLAAAQEGVDRLVARAQELTRQRRYERALMLCSRAGEGMKLAKTNDSAAGKTLAALLQRIEQTAQALRDEAARREARLAERRTRREQEQRRVAEVAAGARSWAFAEALALAERLSPEIQDQGILNELQVRMMRLRVLKDLKAQMIRRIRDIQPKVRVPALRQRFKGDKVIGADERTINIELAPNVNRRVRWDELRGEDFLALAQALFRLANRWKQLALGALYFELDQLPQAERYLRAARDDPQAAALLAAIEARRLGHAERQAEAAFKRARAFLRDGRPAQALDDLGQLITRSAHSRQRFARDRQAQVDALIVEAEAALVRIGPLAAAAIVDFTTGAVTLRYSFDAPARGRADWRAAGSADMEIANGSLRSGGRRIHLYHRPVFWGNVDLTIRFSLGDSKQDGLGIEFVALGADGEEDPIIAPAFGVSLGQDLLAGPELPAWVGKGLYAGADKIAGQPEVLPLIDGRTMEIRLWRRGAEIGWRLESADLGRHAVDRVAENLRLRLRLTGQVSIDHIELTGHLAKSWLDQTRKARSAEARRLLAKAREETNPERRHRRLEALIVRFRDLRALSFDMHVAAAKAELETSAPAAAAARLRLALARYPSLSDEQRAEAKTILEGIAGHENEKEKRLVPAPGVDQ